VQGNIPKLHLRLNLQIFLPNFAVIEEGAPTTTVVGWGRIAVFPPIAGHFVFLSRDSLLICELFELV
jgi:hypothetical protein